MGHVRNEIACTSATDQNERMNSSPVPTNAQVMTSCVRSMGAAAAPSVVSATPWTTLMSTNSTSSTRWWSSLRVYTRRRPRIGRTAGSPAFRAARRGDVRVRLLALLRHRLEELAAALLHLGLADVLLVGRDPPFVPERIRELAEAVAPEHVLERHLHGRARGRRPLERGVAVLDVEVERHGRGAVLERRKRAALGHLVVEE